MVLKYTMTTDWTFSLQATAAFHINNGVWGLIRSKELCTRNLTMNLRRDGVLKLR